MQLATRDGGPWLLMATDTGLGKRTPVSEMRTTSRGAGGVICAKLKDGESLVSVHVVDQQEESEDEDCLLATNNGMMSRIPVSGFKVVGRTARGVKVMRLTESDRLSSMTPCRFRSVSAVTESAAEDAGS